jgi:hypothetical protein
VTVTATMTTTTRAMLGAYPASINMDRSKLAAAIDIQHRLNDEGPVPPSGTGPCRSIGTRQAGRTNPVTGLPTL